MIFEDKVRKIQGPLLRKLSTQYPSLFPPSSLHKAKEDPFDSILRNPEKSDNFFQALDTLNTTSKSHILAKIKATLASVEKFEESNEAKAIKRNPRTHREHQTISKKSLNITSISTARILINHTAAKNLDQSSLWQGRSPHVRSVA
jgi:hypothetical protein